MLGCDCCGKNSVMHALAKELAYKPFMSPRSPICNIVYDRIYKRNPECFEDNLDMIYRLLDSGAYFVLIQAKLDVLMKRALERNEKHVNTEKDFRRHIKVYNEVFNECKKRFEFYDYRFIKVDNSKDIQTTIKSIIEELNVKF
jgi:thymidylate kinase